MALLLSTVALAEYETHTYEGTTIKDVDEGELVKEYCGAVSTRGAILVILGLLMWIAQPIVKKSIKRTWMFDKKDLMFMYKWLGIGILFLGAYATLRLTIA